MSMENKLNEQYAQLCAELGNAEYRIKCLLEQKAALLAKIRQLDELAGQLKAKESKEAPSVEPKKAQD